eukprot:354414-Chlamydomonas_euryale.AAC.2
MRGGGGSASQRPRGVHSYGCPTQKRRSAEPRARIQAVEVLHAAATPSTNVPEGRCSPPRTRAPPLTPSATIGAAAGARTRYCRHGLELLVRQQHLRAHRQAVLPRRWAEARRRGLVAGRAGVIGRVREMRQKRHKQQRRPREGEGGPARWCCCWSCCRCRGGGGVRFVICACAPGKIGHIAVGHHCRGASTSAPSLRCRRLRHRRRDRPAGWKRRRCCRRCRLGYGAGLLLRFVHSFVLQLAPSWPCDLWRPQAGEGGQPTALFAARAAALSHATDVEADNAAAAAAAWSCLGTGVGRGRGRVSCADTWRA